MIRDIDENGTELPSFSHILRVFLIDPDKRIRNIYSTGMLDPRLVVTDVRTLLLEEALLEEALLEAGTPRVDSATRISKE